MKETPIKCAGCGRFMGCNDFENARHIFVPDSHFGPEVSEWECGRCKESFDKATSAISCGISHNHLATTCRAIDTQRNR